jgi:hypothetical protein
MLSIRWHTRHETVKSYLYKKSFNFQQIQTVASPCVPGSKTVLVLLLFRV